MKMIAIAAGLCLAASLAACATSMPDLAATAPAAKPSEDPAIAKARLDALKEVNRHVELCHRTYTLSWPPSGIVDCKATGETGGGLNPADIAAAISKAVVDALTAAGFRPAAPPTSP
jgi:hypothetical protein